MQMAFTDGEARSKEIIWEYMHSTIACTRRSDIRVVQFSHLSLEAELLNPVSEARSKKVGGMKVGQRAQSEIAAGLHAAANYLWR